MDAISPGRGNSVLVTPGGAQQRVNIPALRNLAGGIAPTTSVAVDGTLNAYTAAAGVFAAFGPGDVIDVTGFTTAANNGRKRVTAVTATQLFVSDAALSTDAAETDITINRLRLPSYVMLVSDSIVPKANLWGCDFGTPPASTTAFFVGSGAPLVLYSAGYDQVIVDGASGNVTVTPLENG